MQTKAPDLKDNDDPVVTMDNCDNCEAEAAEGFMRYCFQRSKGKYAAVLFLCHSCGGTKPCTANT